MYGVAAGGFQVYRKGVGASEVGQNQETIRVVNNVFRNMNCHAASVYLTPWDVKDVEVVSNTFHQLLEFDYSRQPRSSRLLRSIHRRQT